MKRNVHRIFWLALVLCMVLTLTACGTQESKSAPSSQVSSAPSQSESDSKAEESSQTEQPSSSSETPSSEISSAESDNAEESVPEETGSKVLVVYFSCTGNTEGVAGKIADALGADTYEIVPEQPYADDDLNYSNSSSRSTMEQNDDSCRPAISGSRENMDDYDTVFIGYPIWWGQAPKIIYTFMESYDFSGKNVVPFCTSGSSPIGSRPGPVETISKEAFGFISHTELRWLGGGGIMLNSRGTVIMIDPVLEGFDMPLLFEPPIAAQGVPNLDGVLITHIDNDHFSVPTCQHLSGVCKSYHATQYIAEVMNENGLPTGHDIGEKFAVGNVQATLTPAWHNWQNGSPDHQYREWKREDYCGYWFDTPDGNIWLPGDSRLLPEHLEMPAPDVILFDFSDNDWHIGLEGAVKLANTYPDAKLFCIHWGTVDAPDFTPFNADPQDLLDKVENPGRILALAAGEALTLQSKSEV